MSDAKIALIEILLVGGVGLAMTLAGLLLWICRRRKVKRCSEKTAGHVVKHIFRGGSIMLPVVEYRAGGKRYNTVRRFNGIITKQKISPSNFYKDSGAYVSEKDYLVIPMGAVTDMKRMADELWPIGSKMDVWYDPEKPQTALAEKKSEKMTITSIITVSAGVFVMILALIIGYLIAG